MTREEFFERATDFYELKCICTEEYWHRYGDDLYEDNDITSQIEDDIREFLMNDYWYNMADQLECLKDDVYDCQSKTGWYLRDGTLDYRSLSYDDFYEMVEEVADFYESSGYFDDEPEEPEEPKSDQCEGSELIASDLKLADLLAV